jgi:RNA polymerase sigma-70 factor (ECF subfamily)
LQDEPQTEDISFVELRGKLMRLAYRMLGSAATSEDVVQEAWIKWTEAGKPTPEAPLAYFSKIVTRICLDHLRKVSTKREKYVGSWLPEPVVARWSLEQDSADDIAEIDISYALMMVMERLSPLERAAYLLHDLFEVPFAEISDILERSPATCRKLATRARENIARAEKRHNANEVELGKLLNVFLSARQSGDISGLAALLSDTVIFYSDGGGKMPAALNPIYGRDKVVRFLQGLAGKFNLFNRSELKLARINGSAAFIIQEKTGELQSLVFDLDDAGQIATFYTVRNPDKLQALT